MAITHLGRLGFSAVSGSSSSIVATLSAGAPIGSFVVVSTGTNANDTTGVTDSRGNTYTRINNWFAYAVLTTAMQSGDTVTVALSGSTGIRYMTVEAYGGMGDSPTYLGGQFDGAFESDSTIDTAALTVASVPALLCYRCYVGATAFGHSSTAGADWTKHGDLGFGGGTSTYFFTGFRVVTEAGNYPAAGTWTGGSAHIDGLVGFAGPVAAIGRSATAIWLGI